MSYIPTIVSPLYSTLKNRKTFFKASDVKYPEDGMRLARLSLLEKQVWIAAQDPQRMLDLMLNDKFKRFWFRYYIFPLKCKRFLYKFKFWNVV